MAARPPEVKILSIGGSWVGKTSLIKRLYGDAFFVPAPGSSIPPRSGRRVLSVGNVQFYAHFWEIEGGDFEVALQEEFYSCTNGLLLVFDLTSRYSLAALSRWIERADKAGVDMSAAVLCGNKADSQQIALSDQEVEAFAKKRQVPYFPTSARTGQNVAKAFAHLFGLIHALQSGD
jgi:small GTP-binding protein